MQGIDVMDVLCDASYNILKLKVSLVVQWLRVKLKTLKLFINMGLIKIISIQWNVIQLLEGI